MPIENDDDCIASFGFHDQDGPPVDRFELGDYDSSGYGDAPPELGLHDRIARDG